MLMATANRTSLPQACPFPVSGRPAAMATLSWGTSQITRYWCQDALCWGRLDRSRLPTSHSMLPLTRGENRSNRDLRPPQPPRPGLSNKSEQSNPSHCFLSWITESGVHPWCRVQSTSWAFPPPGPLRQRLTVPLSLPSGALLHPKERPRTRHQEHPPR